jgi:hypothetical protein
MSRVWFRGAATVREEEQLVMGDGSLTLAAPSSVVVDE